MALLVVGSLAAIGGYMLYQMTQEPGYDYNAYFASNKIKLVMPPAPKSLGDQFLDAVANNWLVKGFFGLLKRGGQAIANTGGEIVGDAISAWLTEFFSSPTTIMVAVALILGLVITGVLISKL